MTHISLGKPCRYMWGSLAVDDILGDTDNPSTFFRSMMTPGLYRQSKYLTSVHPRGQQVHLEFSRIYMFFLGFWWIFIIHNNFKKLCVIDQALTATLIMILFLRKSKCIQLTSKYQKNSKMNMPSHIHDIELENQLLLHRNFDYWRWVLSMMRKRHVHVLNWLSLSLPRL